MQNISEILQRFEGVKQNNANSWQAKCPSHNDKKPSLTITQTSDKILFYCHTGCKTEDILGAVGLTWADIGSEKPIPTWKEKLETWKGEAIKDFYNYKDENGKYLYTKVRFTNKGFIFGKISEDKSFFHIGSGDTPHTLYNLKAVIDAVKKGFPVYYCEGEKDCETLRQIGLISTTAGSVSDWKPEFAKYFIGARVVILPDNDKAGLELKDKIVKDLKYYAHATKVVLTSHIEKGDVSDYITKEGHTKEDLLGLVKGAEWNYAPWLRMGKYDLKVNEGLLAESVERSLQYIILKKQNVNAGDIYVYSNGVYRECGKLEVKGYIRRYLPSELIKNYLLDSVYGILLSNITKIKKYEDINTHERYINVKNGLYDTVKKELKPHTPKVLSTMQYNCNYNPKAPEPKAWLKYINDLCTTDGKVDNEKVLVLQEWCGLLLSNYKVNRVKQSLCLYSSLGNTGKSIFPKPLVEILGMDNTNNVPIQNLSDRFALADIYGKRLIVTGDQKGNDIEDSSTFKELTGGDVVRCEMKGKGGFNFLFTGGIISISNNLPSFKDDKGNHVFERFCLIKCNNVIPPEKRDKMLGDKVLQNLDGVFMWALEGLNRTINDCGFFDWVLKV